MQPKRLSVGPGYGDFCTFGEHDENERLKGRGIKISQFDGSIRIGYYENGWFSAGTKYIIIFRDGEIHVGE